MVYTTVDTTFITAPYSDVKKDKYKYASSQPQRQQQQCQPKKDEKYGAWGPIYKNKEHFVNMHIG